MTGFNYFLFGFGTGFLLSVVFYLSSKWRLFVWKSKGRIFRITKEDNHYYPEKRFLHFFFVRMKNDGYFEREFCKKDAVDYIRNFLQELEQSKENELIDFSK